MAKKRIGVLGGTFDPVHFGHLNLGLCIQEMAGLDEIVLIPAYISPFKEKKPPCASSKHRLEMVKLAIAEIPNFRVDDRELLRQSASYTIDTIDALDPSVEWHLILSDESCKELPLWKDANRVIEKAPPLVGVRCGLLSTTLPCGVTLFNIPQLDISSTAVRARLLEKRYCGHWVPSSVLTYIYHHNLYGT
ncbi:MAG: putative nicotinate-nucleotide adenylyltransferase [Chlamydiota bacterium]|jgi:nicotinate-nucleotide adenylyltransferase